MVLKQVKQYNSLGQYFLHIVIFGKTVIVSPLKVEAIKGAKDMVISNKAGKEAALGQAA